MAWPTWMPIAARPTTWPDWADIFINTVPREWPKRLFGKGTEAWLDLEALGESLALSRDLLQFMLKRLWPGRDEDGTFLSDWEAVFNIAAEATIAKRQDRLIAKFRQRGTMAQALVKAIMCRAWGTDDPSVVSLDSPDQGWTATSDQGGADLGHQMHIFRTGESAEPDLLIEDLISQCKPTWETWTYGQYDDGKYEGSGGPEGGPGGGEGTYNHCTYS